MANADTNILVLERDKPYFIINHSHSNKKYSKNDIYEMLDFLIDNIFVMFSGRVFQQTCGIPMGTDCAPFSPLNYFIRMNLK